jgi:hypothetical protein
MMTAATDVLARTAGWPPGAWWPIFPAVLGSVLGPSDLRGVPLPARPGPMASRQVG